MSKQDNEHNDKALIAWNEWKIKCAVANCEKELQTVLCSEIYEAFQKKFKTICPQSDSKIFKDVKDLCQKREQDDSNKDDDYDISQDPDYTPPATEEQVIVKKSVFTEPSFYWASVFDDGIIAKANAVSSENAPEEERTARNGDIWVGTAKNYKNSTWEKLQQSNDPPLKIIRGTLTGPCGVINAIAEYYLWLNYPMIWENYTSYRNFKRNKKEKFVTRSDVSLDAPLGASCAYNGDDRQKSYGDAIASRPLERQKESSKAVLEEIEETLNGFTNFELALLLARAVKLQAAEETEEFLKAGHTKISNYWNNILRRKSYAIKDLLGHKATYCLIAKRIEAEEGGNLFLSKIRETFVKNGLEDLLW